MPPDTVTVDVQALAGILAQADNGCHVCARELAGMMQKADPDHDWLALVNRAGGWDDDDD